MEDQDEQFNQLRRLLSLKKHEAPPPGYFNRLPGTIITRIRMEQHAQAQAGLVDKLGTEAPWLVQFWRGLMARPALAGGFGAAVCSLILGGLVFSGKPAEGPDLAGPGELPSPFLAGLADPGPVSGGSILTPSMTPPTNTTDAPAQNLFDLWQPLQVAPVSAPGN